MAEQKPGLLKRMFSFGFGRSRTPEPDEALQQEEISGTPAQTQADVPPAPAAEPAPETLAPVDKVALTPHEPGTSADEAESTSPATSIIEKPANKYPGESVSVDGRSPDTTSEKPVKTDRKPKLAAKQKTANKKAEKGKAEVAQEALPSVRTSVRDKIDEPRRAESEPPPVAQPKPVQPAPEPKSPASGTRNLASGPKSPASGKVTLFEPRKPEGPAATAEPEEARAGWFAKLRKGLSRSSSALTENIASVFTKRRLDDETLEELEDLLIQADLGVETAMAVTDALSGERYGKDVSEEEVRRIMAAEIEKVLDPVAMPLELDLAHKPHVILVVGVNGSGKTTTIGKMSAKLKNAGLSALLVAGDTFRAAAIEQLKIWGERTGSPVTARELGADAAGLAWDAWQQARDEGHDVMLMDTAGRLQNKTELMAELEKIVRVLKKHDPEAPHTVLLTLDATTGQNALNQVEIFGKVAGVNGLVMTKLDGTARGGILVAISARHKLPVYFLGVGEGVDDLEPFEAADFARSIAGLDRTLEATEQA